MPGHGPAKNEISCNGGSGATAGELRAILEADRKIDARSKTGKAPDAKTDMREPADKSLLTNVSRFRSCRCTIMASITTHEFVERASCGATGLDMGT